MNDKTERDLVLAAALSFLAAARGLESVLTQPNPKINNNLSLSYNSLRHTTLPTLAAH